MKQRLKNIGLFFLIVSLLAGIIGCSNVANQTANHADEKEIVLAAPRDLAPGKRMHITQALLRMFGNR